MNSSSSFSPAPVQLSSLIFSVLLTRNPLLSLSKCAHQWVQRLQGKQVLPFTCPVLQHYRQLSTGARTQVAATGQVLECVFIHSILSLAVALLTIYNNIIFYKVHIVYQVCAFKWAAPYLLLADGLILLTTVRYAYTLIFFALSGLVQLSLTLYLHLRDLKRLVFRLFGQIKNRRSTPTQIILIWSYFFRQHSLVLTDLMTFNSEVVSTLLFWVCLPLLSSSVYCLCLLYFFRLEPIVRVILCFCLLLHATTFAIFTFLPPVSRALYTVTGQLYRAQMTLPSGKGHHLKGRLKMTAYYEILCTNKKVTYTFGSYAKVDKNWLWEVGAAGCADNGFVYLYLPLIELFLFNSYSSSGHHMFCIVLKFLTGNLPSIINKSSSIVFLVLHVYTFFKRFFGNILKLLKLFKFKTIKMINDFFLTNI